MNKQIIWLLGYFLSGKYIKKEILKKNTCEYVCEYNNKEVFGKIKTNFFNAENVKILIDINNNISLIIGSKEIVISKEKIKNNARHFIRGLIDGSGYMFTRDNRDSFVLSFGGEKKNIIEWAIKIISENLLIEEKHIKYIRSQQTWKITWEGTVARLIAFWAYHGNINNCCIRNNKIIYNKDVLKNNSFKDKDTELLFAAKAKVKDNHILFTMPSKNTLLWCHRLQKLLSYKTVPVYHNKGINKYYVLYIPKQTANTQDTLFKVKA